jgi:hypothetical protein
VYHDSIQAHHCEKKLKKEIINAWVEEWRKMNRFKPTELHCRGHHRAATRVIGGRTARRVQAEVNIALSAYNRG